MAQQIGLYQVKFPIKKGRYAGTYRVTDQSGEKKFLKLFNLARLTDAQYIDRLDNINEIEILRGLNHPNMFRYRDSGEVLIDGQRQIFMVGDFIAGETVAQKVEREKFCSVYEMKRIITGLLNALKYLHRLETPVIHNEISPANVMLDMSIGEGVPKLIDFGHAQFLDSRNLPLYSDGLNPFFMAPEMFKGLYSTRTDLYAVGVMMYYLTFGLVPWYVERGNLSLGDWLKAILEERKKPVKIPDIPIFELDERLLNIIVKAISQDVDARFQSADEFLRALNGELEVEAIPYERVQVREAIEVEKRFGNAPKGNGFADVAGMDNLKERFNTEIIDLMRNPEKYKKLRVKIPNGMLLYGPPGCGKTFIAEKFAEEVGWNYQYVDCSDIASPYIHGGQEKISALFKDAEDNAPTVLFLDELDSLIVDRSRHTNVSEQGEVNVFLTNLNNCADRGIFVIGATNHPEMIDKAALRSGRLEIKVYVPAPDKEARKSLLELLLKGRCSSDIDIEKLAEMTKGYVSKDIDILINKAALIAARADLEEISMTNMLNAIEQSKCELPSVSSKVLTEHEAIRDEFEGRKGGRTRVGFITETKQD